MPVPDSRYVIISAAVIRTHILFVKRFSRIPAMVCHASFSGIVRGADIPGCPYNSFFSSVLPAAVLPIGQILSHGEKRFNPKLKHVFQNENAL